MFVFSGSFTSRSALLAALKDVSISVPPRTDGRKTAHVENWSICRLLATLAALNRLHYPLAVTHRDRPDFILTQGSFTAGIEVTEAISEQYAAYCALAEREFPDVFLQPDHFRWDAPPMSVDDMRALLRQSKLTGPPWAGDRVEREWARYMHSVISAKLLKLAKPGYATFEQNWLAIYDNLPLPNVDLSKALSFLLPTLSELWLEMPSFGTVYIEHGPVIAQVTSQGSVNLLLEDLWE